MIAGLTAQYLLGMYVAMFAARPEDPEFKTEGFFPKIIFGLHGLLGFGLLIGAVVILVLGSKNKNDKLKKTTLYGFLSILLAFLAGVSNVLLKDNPAEISSYVMSVGFILSFIFYGKLFYLLRNQDKNI